MSPDTAALALTEATSIITTLNKNHWMGVLTNAASSNWFIDCGCTSHISAQQLMFITYTKYHPNTIRMTGYNEDPSFAS
jgi:hypothetical protein